MMKIAQSFSQAAATYDAAAVLQREVGVRLLERLDVIKLQPSVLLDLGSGTGHFSRLLEKRFHKSRIICLDIAQGMLQYAKQKTGWFSKQSLLCADQQHLPLKDASVDFIYSNMSLQWSNDIKQVFDEMYRVLKPGGLLLFTTLGPDTLKELRHSWQSVDNYTHVNQFLDMHDVGDALLRSQYADPVMDMEHFTLMYPHVFALMRELKALGAHHVQREHNPNLTGKKHLSQLASAYETFRNKDGRLPATYEVIYGHAWKLQATLKQNPKEAYIPIDSITTRKANS